VNPVGGVDVLFATGDFSGVNSAFTCAVTSGSSTPPVADGVQSYTCTVTAEDVNNVLLMDLPVDNFAFNVTAGGTVTHKVTASKPVNQGGGVYTVQLRTTTADPDYQVTAAYSGVNIGLPRPAGTVQNIPFTFGAPIPPDTTDPNCSDGRLKTYTIAAPSVGVPVGTYSLVQTLVTDEFCNPVEAALVTFAPTGSATSDPTSAVTNADGVASANVTDQVAETTKVTASVAIDDKTTAGGSVTIAFVAGTPETCTEPGECTCPDGSNSHTHLSAVSPVTVPGPSTATALITDKYCNIVAGAMVTFGVASPSGNAALSGSVHQTTNGQGVASVDLTDATAETAQVTATIPVGAANTPTAINGSPAAVEFQAGAVSPAHSSFTCDVTPDSHIPPVADDMESYTCILDMRDVNGNTAAVSDPTLFTFSVSDPGVHYDPVTTYSKGTTPVYVDHFTSITAGEMTVVAYYSNVQITGTTIADGVTYETVTPATPIPFQPGEVSVGTGCNVDGTELTVGQIYSGPQPWAADGSSTLVAGSTANLHVYLADVDCNPIPGVNVDFAAGATPANSGVVTMVIGVTGADGWATGTVTDQKAEDVPVVGAYSSAYNGSGDLLPATVTFTAGEPKPGPFTCDIDGQTVMGTNLTVDPSRLAVGGHSTAVAYVTDENCNPVPGITVAFAVTGRAVLSPSSQGTYTTDAKGLAYANVTDKRAEKVTVSGTFSWSKAVWPVGSATVTFTADKPSVGPFDCLPGQESTNLSASPTSLLVNQWSTVRAYVTDKYCNPIDGVPVTFSSDGSSVLSAKVVNTDPGVATTKLTDGKAETVNVKATIAISDVATYLPTVPPSGVKVAFGSITVHTGGVLASSTTSPTGADASGLSQVWVGIAMWRHRDDT